MANVIDVTHVLCFVVSCSRWSRHCMATEPIPYGSTASWTLPLQRAGSVRQIPRTEFSKGFFNVSVLILVCLYALLYEILWISFFFLQLRSGSIYNRPSVPWTWLTDSRSTVTWRTWRWTWRWGNTRHNDKRAVKCIMRSVHVHK